MVTAHSSVYVSLAGEVRLACNANSNCPPVARPCQKHRCAENVRTIMALQNDLKEAKLHVEAAQRSAERRAALGWESVVVQLKEERDFALSCQRKAEKRARQSEASAKVARAEAEHARTEATEAQEAVRAHASEMIVVLDACVARLAEDAAQSTQDAETRLERERATWCKVVASQKAKVAEVKEMHDTAQQLLADRQTAHDAETERINTRYDEAKKTASNAKRRAANWEKRLTDTLARMPPMPAKPDDDAVPVEQQTKAHQTTTRYRFIKFLKELFGAFEWTEFNIRCLATALFKLGLLDLLWDTREMNILYFDAVNTLHGRMEQECFGERFGVFLHLELGLTLPQITLLSQATCKTFVTAEGRYVAKTLDYSSYSTQLLIHAPRITPPRSFLEPIIRGLKKDTGLELAENGRVSFRPVMPVLAQMIERDAGRCGTPTRAEFRAGAVLHLLVSLDATGFGALQVTTLILFNPRLPQSSANCDILGMGNVSDGGEGATKLLGPNRDVINKIIRSAGETPTPVLMPDNEALPVRIKVWNTADLSCVRHCEHLLGSGMCCCPPLALRRVPKKPDTIPEMKTLCSECVGPALAVRQALGHRKHDGRVLPCPCCNFGHSENPEQEYDAFCAVEQTLLNDTSKGHEGRLSKWALDHAHAHLNVKPLASGQPTFDCDMTDQLPDVLHMLDLNLPARPHSHGLIRNSSDEACVKVRCTPAPPPTHTHAFILA